MTKYSENVTVRQQIPIISAAIGEYIRTVQGPERLTAIDELGLESPIEAMFQLWWDLFYPVLLPQRQVTLHSQWGFAPINGRNYRADFIVWPTDLTDAHKFNAIVIEFDGHDYHERTKEQVIARNQRDRDFQERGYRVLHFSGSEIFKDGERVLTDVVVAASQEYVAFQARLNAEKT